MNKFISKNISAYLDWLKYQKEYKNSSVLWNQFKNDFIDKNFKVDREYKFRDRGYLMNLGSFSREKNIEKYLKTYSIASKIIDIFNYKLMRILEKLFKFIFFKDFNYDFENNYLCHKYGNLKEKYFNRNPKHFLLYEEIFKKNNWVYSVNSFKSFCYFAKFKDLLDINQFNNKTILEIGSGCCNFFMILDTQLNSYTYICLDIPEMIPAGYTSLFKSMNTKGIDIFLPNQIDKALKAKSDKKLIFITPNQLKSCGYTFDLLVNHESFGEMNIKIVNNYLKIFKDLANKNAILFLVNRLAPQTNVDDPKFDNYTLFEDYDLKEAKIIYKETEEMRNLAIGIENKENIFYVGRM